MLHRQNTAHPDNIPDDKKKLNMVSFLRKHLVLINLIVTVRKQLFIFLSIVNRLLPNSFWVFIVKIKKLVIPYYYEYVQWNYNIVLRKIKNKKKIKAAFFLIHDSVWKYDGIYNLLKNDKRFDPVIIVCPYIAHGEELMKRDMEQAYKTFKRKGYNVIKTYNYQTGEWLDVKKDIKPDIVFFTNPHKITKNRYYITNYLDCLTCYAPYSFTITHLNEMQYNLLFHNVLWKYFVESEIHKKMSEAFSDSCGINSEVTGYPGIDSFFDKEHKPNNIWKNKNNQLKRIIWAPHHTIDENKKILSYSNFISLSQVMLDLAQKYKDKIQISFKPHPLLRAKLYLENGWGKQKTDDYYSQWKSMENGQLNLSEYVDLFLTSDGMIMDSVSFLNEYLCVNKPSLFVIRDNNITERFNNFGKKSLLLHYHAQNERDIDFFIKNIIDVIDPLKNEREFFIRKYLMPFDGYSASYVIYRKLISFLYSC